MYVVNSVAKQTNKPWANERSGRISAGDSTCQTHHTHRARSRSLCTDTQTPFLQTSEERLFLLNYTHKSIWCQKTSTMWWCARPENSQRAHCSAFAFTVQRNKRWPWMSLLNGVDEIFIIIETSPKNIHNTYHFQHQFCFFAIFFLFIFIFILLLAGPLYLLLPTALFLHLKTSSPGQNNNSANCMSSFLMNCIFYFHNGIVARTRRPTRIISWPSRHTISLLFKAQRKTISRSRMKQVSRSLMISCNVYIVCMPMSIRLTFTTKLSWIRWKKYSFPLWTKTSDENFAQNWCKNGLKWILWRNQRAKNGYFHRRWLTISKCEISVKMWCPPATGRENVELLVFS